MHDTTNGNGELVCEYASVNDMVVASTFFQHKKKHTKELGYRQIT